MPRYPQLAEDVASRDEDDKDREKREIGSRTSRELASHSRWFERFSGILTVESGRAFSNRLDQLFFYGGL